jgi:cell division GTPase FtsZ
MEGADIVKKEEPDPLAVQAKSNLIVVGFGGCGKNAIRAALEKYDPEINRYVSFKLLETNKRVLTSCSAVAEGTESGNLEKWLKLPERFRTLQLGQEGLGAGGDMDKGEELARLKIDEMEEYFAEFDNAVLIGGGGGGTCGAMPVIAEALNRLAKPTYAILTMPRFMEGQKKAGKATRIRDRMLGLCPTTLVENEHIPNKTLSYSGVWKEINEGSLHWILWLLKALLQDEGDIIDIDGADWRTATSVGKHTVPGYFDASNGLDSMEEGLLGNPYLNAEGVIKKALAVDFWFEGLWPVEHIERVVKFIRSKMEHGEREEELELKMGIREAGVPKGTKTVGFVAFAKEGPDAPSADQKVKVSIPLKLDEAPALPAIEAPVPPAIGEPAPDQAATEASVHDSTNGVPAPPMEPNGNGNGHKVPFVGVINGKKVSTEVSPAVVTQQDYDNHFRKNPSLDVFREGQELQKKLREETGLTFDVQVQPTIPKWR